MSNKPSSLLPSLWSDNPFRDLRKEMDQALEAFFGNRGRLTASEGGALPFQSFRSPSIDLTENDKAITLTAELPGINEEDMSLSVQNGVLTLKGEKKLERKDDNDNYRFLERSYGTFQRSIGLPESVDENAIAATFDKGVLTVTIPKKPGAAPGERKIAISSKGK